MKTTRFSLVNACANVARGCRPVLAAVALCAAGALPALAQSTPAAPIKDSAAAPRKVILILKDGRRVEGEVISETDAAIKLRVVIAGIKGENEYNKSDIKEMKSADAPTTDAPKTDKPAIKPADAPKDAPKPDAPNTGDQPDSSPKSGDAPELGGLVEEQAATWGDQKWRIETRAVPSEADGPKVYMIYMGGEFGRDVSFTPMREVVRDIKKYEPDVVVCFFDTDFVRHGNEMEAFQNDASSFDQLEIAGGIASLLPTRNSPAGEWTKKPRLVSWVRKAMGGAAFLPFIAPEMYYTPDANHGGIGNLEHKLDGVGDERAREKQYSLRQARGEGLCELGGHEKKIMRAMARTDYVLSVKFVDGEPVWYERMPSNADEILLTDDGKEKNADFGVDVLRGKGNDTLVLDASMALRLGLSRGTAENLDDLMDRMGLSRNYVLIKGRGHQILREWAKKIDDAEKQITRLQRNLREVRVKAPGDYNARSRARGERKTLLNKMKAIFTQYKESLNPERLGGAENNLMRIEIQLQTIEAEQLDDKRER